MEDAGRPHAWSPACKSQFRRWRTKATRHQPSWTPGQLWQHAQRRALRKCGSSVVQGGNACTNRDVESRKTGSIPVRQSSNSDKPVGRRGDKILDCIIQVTDVVRPHVAFRLEKGVRVEDSYGVDNCSIDGPHRRSRILFISRASVPHLTDVAPHRCHVPMGHHRDFTCTRNHSTC